MKGSKVTVVVCIQSQKRGLKCDDNNKQQWWMANSFYILIGHPYRKIKKQVLRIQDLIILIITRRRESKPEFFSHLTFNPLITHAHLVKLSVLLTFSRDNKPIYSLSTAQDRKMCQLKRDSQLRLIRKRNIERAKKFRSKHEAR